MSIAPVDVWCIGCVLVLGILCAFSRFVEASWLSLVVSVAFFVGVLFLEPSFYIGFLAVAFAVAANIAGCAMCELMPQYLPELVCDSYFVGSLPLLAFSRIFMMALLVVYETHGLKSEREMGDDSPQVRSRRDGDRILLVINALIALISLSLFMKVVRYPSFVLGWDRFRYAKEGIISGVWSKAVSWMGFFIIIPLASLSRRGPIRAFSVVAIASYLLYYFWTGSKFGAFFGVVCLVLMASYSFLASRANRRPMLLASALLASMVLLVGFSVFAKGLISGSDPLESLVQRGSQQGQLWWATYAVVDGTSHPQEFQAELDALDADASISENVGANYGIYKIMYLTAPKTTIDNKLSSGSRYTEGGYPAAYYYFGAWGVIGFSVVMALLMGTIDGFLIKCVRRGWWIEAVLLVRIHGFAYGALSMFTFQNFFTRTSILTYVLFFGLALVRWMLKKKDNVTRLSIGSAGAAAPSHSE